MAVSQPSNGVDIRIPDKSKSEDQALITKLVQIVNSVYTETEEGIFIPGYLRTNGPEVAGYIANGQLAVAYLPPSLPASADQQQQDDGEPIGCVAIKQISPTKGQYGMLALDPAHRGGGTGKRMAQFAEDHARSLGCTIMQLELLVPTTFRHAFKERNEAWYRRMGYEVVKLGRFADDWPLLAPQLAGPTDYKIFEKSLVE